MVQYGELVPYPKGMDIRHAELAILARGFNRFGGLHIVIEDYNIEDWCIETCIKDERTTNVERDWAYAMLGVPERYREAILKFSNKLGA